MSCCVFLELCCLYLLMVMVSVKSSISIFFSCDVVLNLVVMTYSDMLMVFVMVELFCLILGVLMMIRLKLVVW